VCAELAFEEVDTRIEEGFHHVYAVRRRSE
jgi:hypothetical protein